MTVGLGSTAVDSFCRKIKCDGATILSLSFDKLPGFSRTWQAVTSGRVPPDLYARAPHAWREAADETLTQVRPWRELADVLAAAGRSYGVPDSALSTLDAVAEGRAVFVVTGQQVGYLGGPLYTFLKAYHATRLARELERELARPVLPLFWLEGEDHDLAEVRDAHVLDCEGVLHTLRFDPAPEIPGFQVGRYAVDAGPHVDELAALLEAAEADSLAILRAAYTATTLSTALGRLLAQTLGARGLLIVEGMDPELKRMALPLWTRVLESGGKLSDLLRARSAELQANGWATPLKPTADAHLFYLAGKDHVRATLTQAGLLRHPAGHTEVLTREELHARIAARPEWVSPKAALRPLYQDFVLPSAVYVAGPGELDYHAQIAPLYRELGVCPPALCARLSVTFVDHKMARSAQKLGLTVTEVLSSARRELVEGLLHRVSEGRLAALFAESRAQVEAVFARLREELTVLDPTLEGATETAAGRALHALGQLREKADRALKKKHAVQLARLEMLLTALKPRDMLSERVLSTGYFLARYGVSRILKGLDTLPASAREHCIASFMNDTVT